MEWYIPLLVFLARICDVSIGTIRIIVVIRGHKLLAALMGFFEVTIWLFAVSAVIATIQDNLVAVAAYASGFAVGTLVGMYLEEKLALGSQMIRVVNTNADLDVTGMLRGTGLIVTRVEAFGSMGRSELCFVVVPRKKTQQIIDSILSYAPNSFLTVEDVRSHVQGSELFGRNPSELTGWRRLIKFR